MAEKSRYMYLSTPATKNRNQPWMIVVCLILLITGFSGALMAGQEVPGKALVMEKGKGNCLACHVIADGVQPGTIGPPLVGMKARFPEVDTLRNQIWDATARNPDSRMPPFGRHGILSPEEIDFIVEYLYTL
jgi:sulfur-oxidizing protein SoxX